MTAFERQEGVFSELAAWIRARSVGKPVLVAIDGIDAAGKTTFSDVLAAMLRNAAAEVVQVSIDGFHNPAHVRYQRAEIAPAVSYYEDSFDYAAFRTLVLDPIRRPGDRSITPQVFDHATDSPVEVEAVDVGESAIVLVDGIFMGRPELAGYWDCWIYLFVEQGAARARGVHRDSVLYGEETTDRYLRRYEPGQALYHTAVNPMANADIVIENTDPAQPEFVRISPIGP